LNNSSEKPRSKKSAGPTGKVTDPSLVAGYSRETKKLRTQKQPKKTQNRKLGMERKGNLKRQVFSSLQLLWTTNAPAFPKVRDSHKRQAGGWG